jgi:hypothetical protein
MTTYNVAVINPRTAEERAISITLTDEQVTAAKSSKCEQTYIQGVAWADIPAGFMPIGNGVLPAILQ